MIETRKGSVDSVTRELISTSVSAIAKFDPNEYGGCMRRWFFRYVEHLPEATTFQKEEGVNAHSQIEHFLETGEDVLGAVVAKGRHLLPAPGPDLLVEWGLNNKKRPPNKDGKQINFFPPGESLLRADGVPLIGFMDWVNPRGVTVTPEGVLVAEPPNTCEAGDNKTTSRLSLAKSPEDLIKTTQMSGYGEFLLQRNPSLEFIRLSHVVFQTGQSRAAKKVTALVRAEDVRGSWQKKGHDVVRQMREVARMKSEADVPANLQACGAFNKVCDFRHVCSAHSNISKRDRLKMGLLKKTGTPAAPAAAAATNGAVTSNTPWLPPAPGLAAAPAAVAVQIPVPPIPSAAAPKSSKPVIFEAAPTLAANQLLAGQAVAGTMYHAPDGTNVTFVAEATPGWRIFAPANGGAPKMIDSNATLTLFGAPLVVAQTLPPAPAQAVVVRDAGSPPPPAPLAAQVAAPVEAKRGRGRPKKSEAEKAAAAAAAPAEAEIELFINAVPPGKFENLSEYVNDIIGAIEEQFQVTDLRCAPNDSPLAFGKWQGVLASAVKADPPDSGRYAAFTKGNEFVAIVAETLAFAYPESTTRGL